MTGGSLVQPVPPGLLSERDFTRVVREYAARPAAALVRVTGDLGTAEDLVQEALVAALKRWPTEGVPDRPDAWLFTVARNRALDMLRREDLLRRKLTQLQWPPRSRSDDRLR